MYPLFSSKMSTVTIDYRNFEVWFMYDNGESRSHNIALLERLCSHFNSVPSIPKRLFLLTHTLVMKEVIRWYQKKAIRQPTSLVKVERIHFFQISWSHSLLSLLSQAMTFIASIHCLKLYHCKFERETSKGTLFNRMAFWNPPLPTNLVFRSCGMGPREIYCLKQSLLLHDANSRTFLHIDGNYLSTSSMKILFDVDVRTRFNIYGYTEPVLGEFKRLRKYLDSTQRGKNCLNRA